MIDILEACKDLTPAELPDGTILVHQGGTGGQLYVLIEGKVRIRKGEIVIAEISEPGAIFGEISALLGIPHTATVEAVGPVRAHLAHDGAAFISQTPDMALHAARILARRLFDATSYLADLKEQFQDHANHFAMMDLILDKLMQQQRIIDAAAVSRSDDPRL